MKFLIFFLITAICTTDCGNEEQTANKDIDSTTETKNTNSMVSEVAPTTTTANNYIITNDGIAGLKLGMHIDEVKSANPGLTCEKVIMEIDEIEFYRLKKGEELICQFELDPSQNVIHISIGDTYKTDKGIGTLSTVAEVKKHYTVLPYKIAEGAEGLPFICLTVKEMPNIQMWLNVEVPEDYYTNEQKVLSNVPETAKIIGVYIEKAAE